MPAFEDDQLIDLAPDRKVKKPRKFKVILHNDDYTTMEFDIHILISVFHHPLEKANMKIKI